MHGLGRTGTEGGGASSGGGGGGGGGAGGGNSNKRGKTDQAAMFASALGMGVGRSGGAAALASRNAPSIPKTFRLNKQARVQEACAILLEAEESRLPDVILLQEVDADMLAVLSARLGVGGRYRPYPPSIPMERRYFTLVFIRVSTVAVLDSGRQDFPGSRMGRDLTSIRCKFNGKPLLIMTSHLESEKQSSGERKAQFNQVLRKLLSFREGPAVFAGDTNLREPEVKQEKLAKEAGDMWQLCGANPDLRFTWDTLNNDNLSFDGGFKPRARYDRMFVNSQAKSSAKSFALLGTQRMAPPEACFPSDHFGLDACFEW
eukprot:jgi/Undpi1/5004/HiC_scaffold_19.g08356.m1